DSGTCALTRRAPERSSIAWTWPRRAFRSPMTSPMSSSGVVTSTAMSASRITGLAWREASLKAIEPAALKAIPAGPPSWYGHAAAGDLVVEGVGLTLVDRLLVQGLQTNLHLRELTGTTGLLLVGVVVLVDGALERLAVRDLGLAHVGLDLELALHAVHQHVEVQLAHAADDGLPGLVVQPDGEGRVLLGELLDGGAQLLLVGLGLGLDGDVDDRVRE